ncbi:MAG TPA: TVP38/TMEM64 family protein [Candidatus Caccovivens faecavium]|nr:TVP38/TMEM64 family protein [Candidatus Caccovivens faecavium]
MDKKQGKEKKELSLKAKILRTILVCIVIAGIVVLGYYILNWTGVWEQINSVEKLQNVILSWGFWGRFGYVILQLLQVTFIPLPSTVTIIAGTLVYGPLQASLLSLAGILLGSMLAFLLGKVFGKKLVVFMVGEKTCKKWADFLSNAKYSFFIMMLLPIFPDDVLCLVAGLTNMSWTFFTVTNLIARPIGVFTVSYFGSGHLIPYHGWGLIVWGILIVLIIAVLILSYKYQKQIENFLLKAFRNKKKEYVIDKEEILKNNEIKNRVHPQNAQMCEKKEDNEFKENLKHKNLK